MENIQMTGAGFEKARDKVSAETLDKPVDEVVAPKEPEAEEVPVESVPETPIETPAEETEEAPAPEEDKVPKSRFLTMHQRAVEAEKALRQFQAERDEYVAPEPVSDDADLKKFYTETFGDTELADKLYKNELARLASIEERAAEHAYERLSQREQQEAEVIDSRVESMDRAFEELSITTGKELTDDEQVAILDIVEKYSPKDKNGKIPEEYLMPLDDAYEIFSLQQAKVAAPNRAARTAAASVISAKTEGAPVASNDADWKPGESARWLKRIPQQ